MIVAHMIVLILHMTHHVMTQEINRVEQQLADVTLISLVHNKDVVTQLV